MLVHVLAIRDIKADAFLNPPMFVHNIGSAIRDFQDACMNKPEGNQIGKHPEDYELYHVDNWSDSTGGFESANIEGPAFQRKQLAVGSNYVK